MSKKFVIIDGNSLINRAYFGIKPPMITKEGLHTTGVYGFLNMLAKFKKEYKLVEHKMMAISGVETTLPKFEVKFIPWLAT